MFSFMDAEREYKKDSQLKKEDVKALAEWVEKQPHLPQVTEYQLILFLHSCYYRIELAKTTVDNFFTVRSLCPELFSPPSVDVLKRQLQIGSMNILPQRTSENYMVMFLKLKDLNPENYNHVKQLSTGDMVFILDVFQKGISNGIVSIFDLKGFTLGHMARFNLSALKKHLFYVQEAAPIRIKGIHCINCVSFIDKMMALIKPFMKKELVEKLKFHTESMDSLYKYVPREILPKDYGGEAPPLSTLDEMTLQNLQTNYDFLKWLDSLKVDETKRPGKPKNAGVMFGAEGSFKKLEVD